MFGQNILKENMMTNEHSMYIFTRLFFLDISGFFYVLRYLQ